MRGIKFKMDVMEANIQEQNLFGVLPMPVHVPLPVVDEVPVVPAIELMSVPVDVVPAVPAVDVVPGVPVDVPAAPVDEVPAAAGVLPADGQNCNVISSGVERRPFLFTLSVLSLRSTGSQSNSDDSDAPQQPLQKKNKAGRHKTAESELRAPRFKRLLQEFDWIDSSEAKKTKYIETGEMFCKMCNKKLQVGSKVGNLKVHSSAQK